MVTKLGHLHSQKIKNRKFRKMKTMYLLFKRFIKLEDCNSTPWYFTSEHAYSRQLNVNLLHFSSETGQEHRATEDRVRYNLSLRHQPGFAIVLVTCPKMSKLLILSLFTYKMN